MLTAIKPLALWYLSQAGVTNGQSVNSGRVNLANFMNGQLRGCVVVDQTGTLVIKQEAVPGSGDIAITVTVDASLPNYAYPFFVSLAQPYVTITWTQGGVSSTYFRAWATAVPPS